MLRSTLDPSFLRQPRLAQAPPQAEYAKAGKYKVADATNLYFRKVTDTSGTGTWVYRLWLDGKRREMGLGPLGEVTLAQARAKISRFVATQVACRGYRHRETR